MEYRRSTYIVFYGSDPSEEIAEREIESRDISAIVLPEHVDSFRFYDLVVATVTIDGASVDLTSEPLNESHRHWYGGTIFTREEIATGKFGRDADGLLRNMEMDGASKAILTRTGGVQYFRGHHVHVPERPGNE